MRQRNYDALSVLHKLESLHLGRFVIDHEKLCEAALRRNAGSLKELSFKDMVGFRSEEAWSSIPGKFLADLEAKEEEQEVDKQHSDHQRYCGNTMAVSAVLGILLSKLKTLRLDCKWGVSKVSLDRMMDYNEIDEHEHSKYDTIISDNHALLGLLRCCPALESLFLRPRLNSDMEKVGRLLREFCPRLDTIRCVARDSIFWDGESVDDNQYIHLIQGCTPQASPLFNVSSLSKDDADVSSGTEHDIGGRGLKYFEMGLTMLDTTITSALLVHASSLQFIELYPCSNGKSAIKNACRLLQSCPKLKRFTLHGNRECWGALDGLLLFQHEWGCQQLESLRLVGFADTIDENELEVLDEGYNLESSQEQIYLEMLVHGRAEAFGDSQSPVSSNNTSATAPRNRRHKLFTPGHWRIAWKPRVPRPREFSSASGDIFRRALFQRADSMPNLVHLGLNEMHYARDKPN
ncbi:hypothetical protein BGZ98_008047 [Dissophora globulifera]|nr:hypothetical protein BGZ98_008047 [Dissophora globulifera]